MTDTQSMPVEAGAEATTKGEKKPADSKSRRNRLDKVLQNFDPETLVKPAEVESPDEAKHTAAVQALKKKIDASEEKIKSIEDEISGLKGVREKQNEATKAMSAELRAFRQQVREKQVNKDSLSEQLGLLSEKKKQSAERLRTQRKQYKTTDATAIDAEIASIQKQLETSTLDLKTEKEKVHEIKKLTAQKDSIKELDAAHAALKAQEEQHEAMYRKYKAAKEEVQALRVTERDMVAKLDAAKAGAVEGDESAAAAGNANSKIEELMGEKAKLIESNKEARSEMKNLSTNLKIRCPKPGTQNPKPRKQLPETRSPHPQKQVLPTPPSPEQLPQTSDLSIHTRSPEQDPRTPHRTLLHSSSLQIQACTAITRKTQLSTPTP
jgi:chromosome segregation ATPase